ARDLPAVASIAARRLRGDRLSGANIFFGIVFPQGSASWEAHLAGALAGLAYARLEMWSLPRLRR
ncbi:MAG: hypothetical protein ACREVG_14030, partial [Burkholderiales bacterium]